MADREKLVSVDDMEIHEDAEAGTPKKGPTAEEIKGAMRLGTPVEWNGKIFPRIEGFCCRVSRPDVYGNRRIYAEVEIVERNGRGLIAVDPKEIKLL